MKKILIVIMPIIVSIFISVYAFKINHPEYKSKSTLHQELYESANSIYEPAGRKDYEKAFFYILLNELVDTKNEMYWMPGGNEKTLIAVEQFISVLRNIHDRLINPSMIFKDYVESTESEQRVNDSLINWAKQNKILDSDEYAVGSQISEVSATRALFKSVGIELNSEQAISKLNELLPEGSTSGRVDTLVLRDAELLIYNFLQSRVDNRTTLAQKLDLYENGIEHNDYFVDGEWIYFNNNAIDENLYRMKFDGSNREMIGDVSDYILGIKAGWIYFIRQLSVGEEELGRMKTDGSQKKILLRDKDILFITIANDGWIYYNYFDKPGICKIKNDGTGRKIISNDKVDKIWQVEGDWIYYTSLEDNDRLYRMKKDGSIKNKITDDELLKNSNNYIYINTVGDYVYYINNFNENAGLYRVNTDGRNKIKIADGDARVVKILGDWIYYQDYSVGGPDYLEFIKIKNDGSNKTRITGDEPDEKMFIGGYILYSMGNSYYPDDKHELSIYKTDYDGKNKMKIFSKKMSHPSTLSFVNENNGWIYFEITIKYPENPYEYKKLYRMKTDGSNLTEGARFKNL